MDRWVADAHVITILKIARYNFQKNSKQMERVTVENKGLLYIKSIVKILNLFIILLFTHLFHFFPVSIHYTSLKGMLSKIVSQKVKMKKRLQISKVAIHKLFIAIQKIFDHLPPSLPPSHLQCFYVLTPVPWYNAKVNPFPPLFALRNSLFN